MSLSEGLFFILASVLWSVNPRLAVQLRKFGQVISKWKKSLGLSQVLQLPHALLHK